MNILIFLASVFGRLKAIDALWIQETRLTRALPDWTAPKEGDVPKPKKQQSYLSGFLRPTFHTTSNHKQLGDVTQDYYLNYAEDY